MGADLLSTFYMAVLPVAKLLLTCACGAWLGSKYMQVLTPESRKHMNMMIFLAYTPALIFCKLTNVVSVDNIVAWWYMPFNVILCYLIGSGLAFIVISWTNPPPHLKYLVIACCASGNIGNVPLVLVPSICLHKDNPFGTAETCSQNGTAYISFGMLMGMVLTWSFIYNLLKPEDEKTSRLERSGNDISSAGSSSPVSPHSSDFGEFQSGFYPPEYQNVGFSNHFMQKNWNASSSTFTEPHTHMHGQTKTYVQHNGRPRLGAGPAVWWQRFRPVPPAYFFVTVSTRTKNVAVNTRRRKSGPKGSAIRLGKYLINLRWMQSPQVEFEQALPSSPAPSSLRTDPSGYFKHIAAKYDIKRVFTPPTAAALAGLIVGLVPQLKWLFLGPLRVITESAEIIGEAMIPCMNLVLGASLMQGANTSELPMSTIVGIIFVRLFALPVLGMMTIKIAHDFGFLPEDPLFRFVLMLQFTMPTAMNVGTVAQLHGIGEKEVALVLFYSYMAATVLLTFWVLIYLQYTFGV